MVQHTVADIDAPALPNCSAETTIREALRTMLDRSEPQLGIVEEDEFLGVVTYRSLSRSLLISDRLDQQEAILDRPVSTAVSRTYPVVHPDEDLPVLFGELSDSPYVLVEHGEETKEVIRDLHFHQFLMDEMNEFLVIEDIELTIRDILREECEDRLSDQLGEVFGGHEELRTPSSIEDCSFRHYAVFISAKWDEVGDRFEHKSDFVRELIDRIGTIRNQLFHFRVTEDSEFDTEFLEFAREHLDHIHRSRENAG